MLPNPNPQERDPEKWLRLAEKQDESGKRGRLKIFLGFAAGVGKTFAMLQEAHRRKQREHQDIVVGFIETHGRKATAEQVGDLEIVPRKKIEYRETVLEEMDVEAILKRRPQWCLVDELAHTNVPGSKNEKRWEDVDELLDAGINVLTTLNIQHLESLNQKIHQLTGIRVRETIPDYVLQNADEVVDVDVTPRALRHRIQRGEVYRPESSSQALDNFFREDNLIALRELCLRELAGRLEHDYKQMRPLYARETPTVGERILICVVPGSRAHRIIWRGYRLAQIMAGEATAIYVKPRKLSEQDSKVLTEAEGFLKRMNIPFVLLEGEPSEEIIRYVRKQGITHIVMGHIPASGLQALIKKSVLHAILRFIPETDITVVGEPIE